MLTNDSVEAVERALLYVFQLSDKDYRKMRTALSGVNFIHALKQDGYSIVPTPDFDALLAVLDAARWVRDQDDELNEAIKKYDALAAFDKSGCSDCVDPKFNPGYHYSEETGKPEKAHGW